MESDMSAAWTKRVAGTTVEQDSISNAFAEFWASEGMPSLALWRLARVAPLQEWRFWSRFESVAHDSTVSHATTGGKTTQVFYTKLQCHACRRTWELPVADTMAIGCTICGVENRSTGPHAMHDCIY